jgi:hypothetical protein
MPKFMFLIDYFNDFGCVDVAGCAPLLLIAALKLYLTDFLNRTFPGENAKNRDFFGGKIFKARLVYQPSIKHGPAHRKLTLY